MILNISVVTDQQAIEILKKDFLIVFIGDCSDREFIEKMSGIPASLFNPPIEAMCAYADGNVNMFQQLYFQYLCKNKDVNEFIVAIVRTLLMDKPIILYLNLEEYNMYYHVLANYLASSYSLIIGDPLRNIPYGDINDNMLSNIISYIYLIGEMDHISFLRMFNGVYSDKIIEKLIADLNMSLLRDREFTDEQYMYIFKNMQKDIIEGRKMLFIKPYSIRGVI